MAKRKAARQGDRPPDAAGAPPPPRRAAPWVWLAILALAISNVLTYLIMERELRYARGRVGYDGGLTPADASPPVSLPVINGHEHLYKIDHLKNYMKAADEMGIEKTVLVASSSFTFMGKEGKREEGYEWSSDEVLNAAKAYPGKIIPFCSIYSGAPDKLDQLKRHVAAGAQGLKLYSGHSEFYDRKLDDPTMTEVYRYCQETSLPIVWHVNMESYGSEFVRVLEAFPKLKVILPHFGVTFFRPKSQGFAELQVLLGRFPGLYVDISFGTRQILVQGLEVVSENVDIFRPFFEKYPDKIIYGTDMVITGNKEKTADWYEACIRAMRDMLEKERYHFYLGAKGSNYAYAPANNIYGEFRGLALPGDILGKVYRANILKVLERPGTPATAG